MTYTVYVLRERGDTEFRYVGQTKRLPEERLYDHLGYAMNLSERFAVLPCNLSEWIMGSKVDILRIATCDNEADAKRIEKGVINIAVTAGHRIFNSHHVPRDKRINRNPNGRLYSDAEKSKVVE